MTISNTPSVPLSSSRRNPRLLLRAVLIITVYLLAFIILDFFTLGVEVHQGVVAWYPPAGLSYTLLLVLGISYTPIVTIALLISSIFIYRMPQPLFQLFLWALVISSIYGVATEFMRRRMRFDWQLRKMSDVTCLVVTSVLVSGLLAVLSISSSALTGSLPRSEVLHSIFVWWIGETVGVLTVTPFLLIHVMPRLKRFAEGQPVLLPARWSLPRPTLIVIGQALSLAGMFYWVFGAHVLDEFRPMYLIALPLIWIALQHGFKGVTVGIAAMNFGVALMMWFNRYDFARLDEIQLLMIIFCIVGLFMGAAVTDRKQAEAETTQQMESTSALYTYGQKFSGNLDAESLASDIVRTHVEVFGVSLAYLLRAETDGKLCLLHAHGLGADMLAAQVARWNDSSQEQTPASRAFRSSFPVIISDLTTVSGLAAWRVSDLWAGLRCSADLPLIRQKQAFGVLGLVSDMPGFFTPDRVDFFKSLAQQFATALENARLFEETARRLGNIEALHTIDQTISASFDLRLMLSVILEQVVSQLKVDAAEVLLLDPHSYTLTFAAERGFRSETLKKAPIRLGEDYAGRAVMERIIVKFPNLPTTGDSSTRSSLFKNEGFIAYFAAPLISKGKVVGVLEVFHRKPLNADEEWLAFFQTLAGQTALAIDNTTLFTGLQRSNTDLQLAYDTTIEGWSRAMDLRDKETEGHSKRVTELTVGLARKMSMSEEEIVHLRRGALLHDMGKLGVPDGILLKPGELTDEEWVKMRHHPQFAYDILAPVAYLKPALDIPYCHHEKWDGSGYPRGLKGEQIPLAGRIFAIVDMWDALRSDRPYRPAWTEQKTLEYLQSQAGTHFDPRVVNAFLEMLREVW